MRIIKLILNDSTYTDSVHISDILKENSLSWLLNKEIEIENAIIEIKDSKLYWHSGIWYYGTIEYCIWLNGEFRYGDWMNGVWVNGLFSGGRWHNGIWMDGEFRNGEFLDGEFRDGVKSGGTFHNEKVITFKNFKNNLMS